MTNEYLLGISYTPALVHISALKKTAKTYELVKSASLPIDSQNTKKTTEALSQWLKSQLQAPFELTGIINVPESLIFLQELEIPKLTGSELSEAIYWEASTKNTSFPPQAILQWKKIDQSADTYHVVAMAMRQTQVEDLLKIAGDSGIRVQAIEPVSTAYSRIAQLPQDSPILLFHLEEAESDFVVLEHGAPVFSSSVPLPLTSQKREKDHLDQETTAAVVAATKRVLSYWKSRGGSTIAQIFLVGSGAHYTGLTQDLTRALHIPTHTPTIKKLFTQNIPTTLEKSPYLLSIGSAGKVVVDEEAVEVNFLPAKEKTDVSRLMRQRAYATNIRSFSKLNAAICAIAFLVSGLFYLQYVAYNRDINQTTRFVQNHPGQKYAAEISLANTHMQSVATLMAEQKDSGSSLLKLSQWTPVGLTFTKLTFHATPAPEWDIEGTGDRNDVLAFYQKLTIESAAKVTLPYSSLQKDKQGAFKVVLIWQ